MAESQVPVTQESLRTINDRINTITYPSTHQYSFDSSRRIHPTPESQERLDELQSILPRRAWRSLIDIGCAKGMFLLWAIQRMGLRTAIGIDASPQMVEVCKDAIAFAEAPALVLQGSPHLLKDRLISADLVLVLHSYHYLFCGSLYGTPGVASHQFWFDFFADITASTMVFANCLSLDAKRRNELRSAGASEEALDAYHEAAILEAAKTRFFVESHSIGGARPYLVMRRIAGLSCQ